MHTLNYLLLTRKVYSNAVETYKECCLKKDKYTSLTEILGKTISYAEYEGNYSIELKKKENEQ